MKTAYKSHVRFQVRLLSFILQQSGFIASRLPRTFQSTLDQHTTAKTSYQSIEKQGKSSQTRLDIINVLGPH